jgi:nucleoside-diphosphate-sugar epimerase
MEKLIIGCGYLGRRVAARWLAQGHTVYGMTRDKPAELQALGIRPIVGDVRELLDFVGLPPTETILYAVAPGREQDQTAEDVWIKGLTHLTAVLPQWSSPPRLLLISSTSVYGQTDGELVDEELPTEPREPAGRVLLEAEHRLLSDWWPDAIVLRFAAIYGPGRWLRSKAIQAGEPIMADPDKWLNLIHVEDGADTVLAAEARGRAGAIYNVSDGHPARRRDFYTRMAEALGAPPPRFVLPTLDTLPPHETANRRISNQRLREELKVELKYPHFMDGLRQCREKA